MSVHILLADDHQITREGLAALLGQVDGVEVVAQAGNGREAVKLARQLCPDMVIMDVAMPDLNGVEATRAIIAQCTGTRVIGLSVHTERQFVVGMLKAGASAYLLKDCAFQELVQAIQAVQQGGTYLTPAISSTVLEAVQFPSLDSQTALADKLTSREREILQLIAEAKTSKEIASLLNLSIKTVHTHRKNIMDKLKAKNLSELTRVAIREGISPLG